MLFGRDREISRIARLISDAKAGTSGVLVLTGEAGVGKTALLDHAVSEATGMRVLRARGVETEAEIAHAGLLSLARPFLDLVPRLPEPQALALAGALGISPPHPGDRFAVYAGLLSLLAAAAEDGPLLVAIDDLQWLDASSRDASLFVARRLGSEGIALILASRDPDDPAAGDEHQLTKDLPTVRLSGVDLEAAAALIADASGSPPARWVVERLVNATAGNPLTLLDLATLLSSAQLSGREQLDDPLPAPINIRRSFRRRVDALSADTRRALVLVAASDQGAVERLAQALRRHGSRIEQLEPAEAAGLLSIQAGEVRFRHPLVRAAVYHDAPAPARRAAHRALADAFADGSDPARWAWHTGRAAVGPDDLVAQALETAAGDALQRSGPIAAARAFAEAARLSGDAVSKRRRLVAAAGAAALGGEASGALELLDGVLDTPLDLAVRADVEVLRAEIAAFGGRADEQVERLVREAQRVSDVSPANASRLLSLAALSSFQSGQIGRSILAATEAVRMASETDALTRLWAATVHAEALTLGGLHDDARGAVEALRSALGQTAGVTLESAFPTMVAALVLMIHEDTDGARSILSGVISTARDMSAPSLLPFALATSAELNLRTGRWVSAYAEAAEADLLAHHTGQENVRGYALAVRAHVEALLGLDQEARLHAAACLETVERFGTRSLLMYGNAALGQLALGAGRMDEAIGHLEIVAGHALEFGLCEPNIVQWAPDLVESYLRAGREEDAARALDELESLAKPGRQVWASAMAARYRAAMAGSEAPQAFAAALEQARTTGSPYDVARTQLLRGEVLRRLGRRSEAQSPLRDAASTFARLGARAWALRAHRELEALGVRRPHTRNRLVELTPQELQVALAVARGATNREAAAALFLTAKTIEYHLRNVYDKLGLRSRTELAVWITRRERSLRAAVD